jgi:MYXO-CTERM domain-containing protein
VLALVTAAGLPPRTALLAGIAGASVLDADKPTEYLLGFNPFPRWLNQFHHGIQRESPGGMRTEVAAGVALAAVAAAVLVRRRKG